MTSDAGQPGTPRFNVVLRGYDRRQVDEHVARLQRVIARMRADLSARSQFPDGPGYGNPQRPPHPQSWSGPGQGPPPGESPDAIAGFTDRMQRILQSAEEEAEEIRTRARMDARAESEQVRAQLDELARQRDGMLRELAQIRGHLHEQAPDPTTRMPRAMPGGPPPSEPTRGGMPSPRPRPAAPPPVSPPPVSPPPPVAQVPGAASPGAPPSGRPAPPPHSPRSGMGDRLGWSSTPPWDANVARPAGEPLEPGAEPTELQPVISVTRGEVAVASDGRRDPESTDQLVGDVAGERGGVGTAPAQNGAVPSTGSGSPSRSDGDAESTGRLDRSQPAEADEARSAVDTAGAATVESRVEPEADGSAAADPGVPGAVAAVPDSGADPHAVQPATAGSRAAGTGAPDHGAPAADAAESDPAEADAADPDVEKTMVVQAVRSSPPTRSGPPSDQGRGAKPGTDQSRPAGSTSRSG